MSVFVCFVYAFKAAVNIVSKLVLVETPVGRLWAMLLSEEWLDVQRMARLAIGVRLLRAKGKGEDASWADSRPDMFIAETKL
jgi:hypothetical protein